jgi:hypothetical protein
VRNLLEIRKIRRSEEWGKDCNRDSRPGMYCCCLLANSAHNILCPLFGFIVLLLFGELTVSWVRCMRELVG